MSDTQIKVLSDDERNKARIAELRDQLYAAQQEIASLRQEDKSLASDYLKRKVDAQANALRRLNRRVRIQRLILRELAETDTDMSDAMYRTVLDKYATELGEDTNLSL